MKSIGVFTSSRSDWGILETLVEAMKESDSFQVTVVVSGAHFDRRYGSTVEEIRARYSEITELLNLGEVGETATDATQLAGSLLQSAGQWFEKSRVDCVVILGDRYEALAFALAAVLHSVPIAHLHGGEVTVGAIDDSIRHALSKLAHIHFPVHGDYRDRLGQMGENPELVTVSGSLAIEAMGQRQLLSREALEAKLELHLPEQFLVCAVHPVTANPTETSKILASLDYVFERFPDYGVVLTAPAPDPGSDVIHEKIQQWCDANPSRFIYRSSLGSHLFQSLVSLSLGIVGNSSSGILEVPSLGVPSLNIGSRQEGRVRADSVIDVEATYSALQEGLEELLTQEFQAASRSGRNPIAGRHPSREIIQVLEAIDFESLSAKKFVDMESEL